MTKSLLISLMSRLESKIYRRGDRSSSTRSPLNSYADSGKVTVLGVGFADGAGVTDGRGAR
ncbi:MAG: hypothetical protein ACYTXE_35370 [Nostoc sp.]